MKLSASPFIVRVWMPILFLVGVYLFFHGTAPEYWLLALPLVLIVLFMATLAEIHDQGHRIHVRRLWHSIDVPREDVAGIAQSLLEGVGVLRLRRFVLPWGRIYFVSDWSKFGVVSGGREGEETESEAKPHSFTRAVIEILVVAISGLLAGRAIRSSVHGVIVETLALRVGWVIFALTLCVVFAIARRSWPSFANVVLFVATFIVGIALW
jgi:hypothetical protein